MGWLTGWSYRKSHNVDGSTAGAQTNYQIQIKVHYGSGVDSGGDVYLGGKCRTDFGDVRFTKSDGSSELDYWIQSKVDGDYAIFWVEVDSIPASPDHATIYIYYGKASATTTSNGSATFEFFDDFSGDLSKWSIISGTWAIVGGELQYTSGGIADNYIVTASYVIADGKIYYKFRTDHPVSYIVIMGCRFRWVDASNFYHQMALYRTNDVPNAGHAAGKQVKGVWSNTFLAWAWSPNTQYYAKILLLGNSQKAFTKDFESYEIDRTDADFASGKIALMGTMDSGSHAWYDDVFVTKYVSPEPANGAYGSEETYYHVSGVTRDSLGNPLGLCTVWLFKASDKSFVAETTSDANGNYSLNSPDNTTQYFVRAHKDGVPHVFGTTDRDLIGA